MKKKNITFWVVIVIVNIALLVFIGNSFLKRYDIKITRKYENTEFAEMEKSFFKDAPSYIEQLSSPPTFLDLRRPHPYCGFKSTPSARAELEEGYIILTNELGFRSPSLLDKPKQDLRIAMVGGSAAWAGTYNDTTIPAIIARKLTEANIRTDYINAGTSSAISNQELGMLVHDIIDQDIDILIAFDGYNDIYHYMQYNGHPGWPPVRWSPASDSPNLVQMCPQYYKFLPPVNDPTPEELMTVVDNYLNVIKKMGTIANAFGIKFIAILQPWRDYEQNSCDKIDNAMQAFYCYVEKYFSEYNNGGDPDSYYCSLADYFKAIGKNDLFVDAVHFNAVENNDEGNRLIADKIIEILKERGYINKQ